MGAGSDQFCNGVGKSVVGGYVEDGKRVFAFVHAAFGEDNGDEMDAGRV